MVRVVSGNEDIINIYQQVWWIGTGILNKERGVEEGGRRTKGLELVVPCPAEKSKVPCARGTHGWQKRDAESLLAFVAYKQALRCHHVKRHYARTTSAEAWAIVSGRIRTK